MFDIFLAVFLVTICLLSYKLYLEQKAVAKRRAWIKFKNSH
jgi:hypothetical protein